MKRFAILAGLVLFAIGCGDETLHSPFLVRVSQINGGVPLQADLIVVVDEATGETAIPEDVVVVRIENRPYNSVSVTEPGTFVHDFQVTGYTVTWRYANGAPLAGFDFQAATTAIVPANSAAEFGLLIAPAGMKMVDPFLSVLLGGGQIQTIADFDIVGAFMHRPDDPIHMTASLTVNFADFADE